METDFQYTLIRRARRRSLTLSISPENQIRVLAPGFLPESQIREFLRRKTSWIQKQFKKNAHLPQSVMRQFEQGEEFLFSGTALRLEIREAQDGAIDIAGGNLVVTVPGRLDRNDRRDYIAWRIEDWYRTQAVTIFLGRVAWYQRYFGLRPRKVRVKEFRGQWGSASRDGNLSFNWRLLLAPAEVLDYVVVHELTHLEHLNHSDRFWARVGDVLPDYRMCRRWLTRYGRWLWLKYEPVKNRGVNGE